MTTRQIFRLRNPALLIALAAVFPVVSYAAGAANIDFAAGNVTAVNALGVQRPLTKGAEISNGDTIRTGEGGRAQVRFSDGAMVSLQPQTDFRIDDYQYSGKADGQEKGFFSLLKGGLRTITGLVGRSSRDNYKVTTSVATIGIRGTEYSAALGASGSELVVNTGEGLVEVCNAAGCMLLASGESGIVSGTRTPSRTDSRPRLDPAQPDGSSLPDYSKSEDRQPNGLVAPVSTPMVSGEGYAFSGAGMKAGTATFLSDSPGTATFGQASDLQRFVRVGNTDFSAGQTAGSFSVDGVVGWGRWTTGTFSDSMSSYALSNFHYVVGVPTPDVTALAGLVATYQLAGFTSPTSSTGLIGGAPTGNLTINFLGGGTSSGLLVMSIPIGGTTQNLTDSLTVNNSGGATFYGSYSNGFLAGSNASHAALTYKFTGSGGVGEVMGAAAFKR